MLHNGIEYGDMQLIAESYHLMREGLAMSADEMSRVFGDWNEGKLDSYLIQITRDILAFKDEDGTPLLPKILDAAGQKGTGRWTVISSLNMGVALTLIAEAVLARALSVHKEERVAAAKILGGRQFPGSKGSGKNSSRIFNRHSTPPRSSPTPRGTT